MTKAAEGFAAECIAEVGVGMAAVTSWVPLSSKSMSASRFCGKLIRWGVDLRNETTIYRLLPFWPLSFAERNDARGRVLG
jgi:hypothetical protein